MNNTPFSVDTPEESLGFSLWQTTMCWQRRIKKALEPFDISHAQFVLLAILLWWQGKSRVLTQVNLIDYSKLDKMTVSKSLKKLASLGYVTRTEHQTDTRAKIVNLTAKGTKLAAELVPLVEGIDRKFFGKLNQTHQSALMKILPILTED